MKKQLFIILLFGIFTACNNLSPKEKELKNILNKPLELELVETVQQGNMVMPFEEFRQQHSHLSVVYLQNSCSPCYPKFIHWQNKMDSIDTPDNYTVLFVIGGEHYGDFMKTGGKIENHHKQTKIFIA